MDRKEQSDEKRSVTRFVVTDLAKGSYALACLALDIFVPFQLYYLIPTELLLILCVVLVVIFTILQAMAYRALKTWFAQEPIMI
jgi:uncharacterized membrane protein